MIELSNKEIMDKLKDSNLVKTLYTISQTKKNGVSLFGFKSNQTDEEGYIMNIMNFSPDFLGDTYKDIFNNDANQDVMDEFHKSIIPLKNFKDPIQKYFGKPIKDFGEPIIPGSTVPKNYIYLLNKLNGNLFGALLIKDKKLSLSQVVHCLDEPSRICLDPPINLSAKQSFYGKISDNARKSEVVRICPHHLKNLHTIEYMLHLESHSIN